MIKFFLSLMSTWVAPFIGSFLTLYYFLILFSGCSGSPVRQNDSEYSAGDDKKSSSPSKHSTEKISGFSSPNFQSQGGSAEYHFSLAQAYVTEGNSEKAIEEFKLALIYDPKSALLHARLASEYSKKGMFSSAMEHCKQALQLDPKFRDARMMLAGLYSTTHNAEGALEEYRHVLQDFPTYEDAAIYYTQVLIENGRAEEGIQSLREFQEINNESALSYYYLGRAEQSLKHTQESIEAYQKSISIKPNYTQAIFALGFLYEEKGMTEEAIKLYKNYYLRSRDIGAANRLATLLLKNGKYSDAIPYLEAIQGTDPDDLNVQVKLGLIHMELKQFERAISIFQAILKKSPDSDRIHYYLGSIYEETRKLDLAIRELQQIKPSSRLYQDAMLHIAYLLKQSGDLGQAKSVMNEAMQKSPPTASLVIFQASLEEDSKNVPKAIEILEKGLPQFPEDEKLRYYLGSLYDKQGDSDKGLIQMEEILKINPKNVDAMNYVGYTWTIKGIRLEDAEAIIKQALSLKPNNGYIQDSWGWLLFVTGRTAQAVIELEKAVKLKPNESTILEHLADAYLKSNLYQKALARYQEAAKYADDDQVRNKIKSKIENIQTEFAQKNQSPSKVVQGKTQGKTNDEPQGESQTDSKGERIPAGKKEQ